eukprot:40024_1
MELRDVLNYVSFAISLVMGICMVTWFSSFYRLRHLPEIAQRRVHVSLAIGILCIFAVLIAHPLLIIFMNFTSLHYVPWSNLILWIALYCTGPGSWHLLTWRTYMVYYDIQWHKAIQDSEWRLYVDPQETNWFLKNKQKWGSSKTFIIVFIHFLLWLIIGATSVILNGPSPPNTPAKMVMAISAIIVTIADCILYCKMPSFNDVYYIYGETTLLLRLKIMFILLFLLLQGALKAEPYTVKYIVASIFSVTGYFGFTVVMYYVVLKKFNLPINPWSVKKYLTQSTSFLLTSREQIDSDEENIGLTLPDILGTKHGFNHFARYLTRQFAIENLLFFVETQQWLEMLRTKNAYRMSEENDVDVGVHSFGWRHLLGIKLSDYVPKSRIVMNDEKVDNTIQYPSDVECLQCVQLFKKYVMNEASFCVNIDGNERTRLYGLFGCNKKDKINGNDDEYMMQKLKESTTSDVSKVFHIWDGCRRQIYQLLNYAFFRFSKSPEFKQVNFVEQSNPIGGE